LVGNYAITASLGDQVNKLGNYSVTTNGGTLTINAALLTVNVNSTNRVYGVTNPVFTGAVLGLLNGDTITATYSSLATTNSPVGTYPILPSLNDPTLRLGNYVVTTNAGTLTITAATAASLTRIVALPNGHMRILGVGQPGVSYQILASPVIAPADWQPIGAVIADENGNWEFVDTGAPGIPIRFYLVKWP